MSSTTEQLEQRRQELSRILATPTEREAAAQELAAIDAEIAASNAVALKADAERRLLAIRRAYGSLMNESEKDDARIREAASAFTDAMITLDERFLRLSELRREAAALAEVFGLEAPELSSPIVPALRESVKAALLAVNSAPIRDTGFVAESNDRSGRRTYNELSATEGFALIQRARAAQ